MVDLLLHFHLDIDIRELVGEGDEDKVFAGWELLWLQEVVLAEGGMVHLNQYYDDNNYENDGFGTL